MLTYSMARVSAKIWADGIIYGKPKQTPPNIDAVGQKIGADLAVEKSGCPLFLCLYWASLVVKAQSSYHSHQT